MRFSNIRNSIRYTKNQLKIVNINSKYFLGTRIILKKGLIPWVDFYPGYKDELLKLRNKYLDKRCFIIGGGPSLNSMNLTPLKDELTIGLNGVFKKFPSLGFTTNFLMAEDENVVKSYGDAYGKLDNITKLFALHNSKYIDNTKSTIFFNTNFPADNVYWQNGREFSKYFFHIAYLGGTITYLALQFAYLLGCKEVYLLGIDFSYGDRYMKKYSNLQGQEVVVDEEMLEILKESYFDPSYISLKTGDLINVPNWDIQKQSFEKARQVFEESGRKIYNAGIQSKLDVFEKVNFISLF
ncbi:6-hydroxymethylpterin diphosphokinase MptE-like protein [Pontibacter harenae]|uniref:6-hydroxymethylpterin diphosphokinase MptE-like protein n=1 Tax=Pontibacter harenae TaxID=2894083 RepID=UPI001E31921F|nr:6-hydroxymethylpterin diphosphokinase MptE-like protein [Pontibacter harenae]MCC9168235.1 DUF115 domain-containing protein [Pontibacter harenae]